MKIYHYSDKLFNRLETRAFRKQDLKFELSYRNHISFFFERPNVHKLPELFEHQHHFWIKGNEIYEYEVDLNNLIDCYWKLVEHPMKTKWVYNEIDNLDLSVFEGTDLNALKELVEPLLGKVDSYYAKLPYYPNWSDLKLKYAACVPHLMLYIKQGYMDYKSVSKIII